VRFSNDAVLYRLHDVLTALAHRCAHRAATRATLRCRDLLGVEQAPF
jgi:hypothetical protein